MHIKVAIIEDDKHYNHALKKIIDYDNEMLCVGQYYTGKDALTGILAISPDVILTDIKLPDLTGIEVIEQLKPKLENSNFIMCTSFEDDNHIYKALKAGASGYLRKGESMERIISSIKESHLGGAPMSFGIAKKVLQYFRGNENDSNSALKELTKTEHEVLDMLAKGMQYKEIADNKCVSIDTIKKHVGNIYRKLQVNNKIEAINILNNSNYGRVK